MRDISRVKEKLWEALYMLVGSAPIEERLDDVRLQILAIIEDNIPEEIVDDFAFVKHKLRSPSQNLTSEEGTEIGRKILGMYTELKGGITS